MIVLDGIDKYLDEHGISHRRNVCGDIEINHKSGTIVIYDDYIRTWSGLGCEIDYGYSLQIKSASHAMEVIKLLID